MAVESRYWAHSKNDLGERHDLAEHLTRVAALAKEFAEPFGGGELAYWAGLWHDLGKFHPEFQEYLLVCEMHPGRRQRGPDHKGAGAVTAARSGPLAFLVAGHHGGLHSRGDLGARLTEWQSQERVREALERARAVVALEPPAPLQPPSWALSDLRQLELFLRMLFSCLVDADSLDTEAHFRPDQTAVRKDGAKLGALWPTFEAAMATIGGRRETAVGRLRDDVYQACLSAGGLEPGLFRLTVPTGGGKTLAGMAFALRHAAEHGLERVIVAVPYTSITEQTAGVYRDIFGEGAVLEHHSAMEEAPDPDETDGGPQWERLAAENWDAPVIVTTTVRLFESLFARKPSDCRRLHRIARSVVILDEAQTLPSRLLAPILDVLGELTAHYGTSVVLCTATQPALDDTPGFRGLRGVREIAPEPRRLFAALERVRYEWPKGERWTWSRVAAEMRTAGQALAIVNTKADALALLEAVGTDALHLSTQLCGAHRRDVLAEVQRRLRAGEPCLLVSTQVVEAGVDLDFPLVLRAMGPLDRLVQAAGRCNREGRMRSLGRVVVFEPADGAMPSGDYTTGAELTAMMMRGGEVDPNDPATFTRYFRRLYDNVELDAERIQEHRALLDYPTVAERFRMIDDTGEGVLVEYRRDGNDRRVDAVLQQLVETGRITRELRRAAQPFVVQVRPRQLEQFQRQLLLEEVVPGLLRWRPAYDPVRGLVPGTIPPDRFIV